MRPTLARTAVAALIAALVACMGCDHPETEPNDNFSQGSANPIQVGPGDQHGGWGTLPAGDVDWWRIDTTRPIFGGTGPDTVTFGIPPATGVRVRIVVLSPFGQLIDRAQASLACPWNQTADPQKKQWCVSALAWALADDPVGRGVGFVVFENGVGNPVYGFLAD